ncbi:MAG: SDR family NAD(P)-dependent oxidoreductase, partial [Chloroflexi bacterium]|nr:SDR family NAD(P)-dependent oxidoreductase [Chloroflexota bacterium]
MRFDGQTILITGASSGIGLGYAQEFAMRGANLVLVARSSDRLGNLASQLHAQYGITVEPISTDLSVAGA